MDAQGARQLPQAVGQANMAPNGQRDAGLKLPVLNKTRFSDLEAMSTQNTKDTIAYCDALWNKSQATRDTTWLELRRFTLQRYLAESEYFSVLQVQGRNAVQAALELPEPHMANVATPNNVEEQNVAGNLDPPAKLEDDSIVKSENTPVPSNHGGVSPTRSPSQEVVPDETAKQDVSSAAHRRSVELYPRYDTPPKLEHDSPEPRTISVHEKISYSWHTGEVLRFTLEYVGPMDYVNPAVYYGRWNCIVNGWHAEQWRPKPGGADTKCHIILATRHNLAICLRALKCLIDHKHALIRQLADIQKLPLRRHRRDI
ncbi:hypothetical protein F4805DRAFT_458559 [Annulohypoxylon moriforme]|nr:hypothetical protein F4805DRAFT_458559 [Annulohypoxylon moriforme]